MLSGSDKSVYYTTSQQPRQLVYGDAQPLSSIGSQWSNTIYPFSSFGQLQQQQHLKSKSMPANPKSGEFLMTNVQVTISAGFLSLNFRQKCTQKIQKKFVPIIFF
jgi:hypothetical protein